MNAATLGPSGRASSAAMYSSQFVQVLCSSTAPMTCSRGIASTRPKMSPASAPSTWTVDSEQRPEHHGRHAVAQRLRQRRTDEHLDVVVGVDVEHAGQHPLAGRVDDLGAVRRIEVGGGYRDDVTIADADVAHRRRCAGAVEPTAVRMIVSYVTKS